MAETEKRLYEGMFLFDPAKIDSSIDQAKQIVEELYIRCLTRRPTEKEKNELNAVLAQVEDKKQVLEDVFWALLNAREFVFNH